MQQGSARPLAVKYMSVHGRPQSDQGFSRVIDSRYPPAKPGALSF
jgi:hypothetical protein